MWIRVCALDDIEPERGVAALVQGEQVAVFRTFDGSLYAIGNLDPFSGAYVLSRGIVGSRGDIPTVASPLHKQVFDLRTGSCFDNESARVAAFPVRQRGGHVEVRAEPEDPLMSELASESVSTVRPRMRTPSASEVSS